MHELKIIVVLSALVFVGAAITVVGRPEQPTLTPEQRARLQIEQVKDGLFVIPGFDGSLSGGNVAVRVTDEGVIIVDDKFPYSFSEITAQVASVTSQPIRYVLNTHHHGDHAGSNADFMKTAEVIAHRNARANIVRNNQPGAPRVVFADQTAVFLGGVEVQAHHVGRGHTNGDAVIYFPDLRTVHTGDLVIWGERMDGSILTPFWDYANGGSAMEWVGTLDRALELDFDTVIPGHGPLLTKDDVRTFRRRLQTVLDRMTDLIDSGVRKEDLAGRFETDDLNWPFTQQRLAALYDEVVARR